MASIVGRESELAVVEAFLDGDRGDPRPPRILAIVGEAGIGKTTLWEEAVRRARTRAATVLAARPAEPESTLSFAALGDLLAAVPSRVLAALPVPQRHGLEVALLRAEPTGPPDRRLLGTALLGVLRELAAERLVLVAIDDLQWLDRPSGAALEFACRRLADEPVRLIVSRRSDAETPALRLEPGQTRTLELGPLSLAALHRIIAGSLGATFPRPTLLRIAQASACNPLYALEIARLLGRSAGPAGAAEIPVPEDLRSLVAERVQALPAGTRAALLRAATLARPDLSLVDHGALAPAEEAGLVRVGRDGRVEFAHPLFASAVYASAPSSRRRREHRALAEAVADAEERARHLALGAEGPDEAVARKLEEAARRAQARGAPEAAADLSELALQLTPVDQPSPERLLLAADHQFDAGDLGRSQELLESALRLLSPGSLRAQALLRLGRLAIRRQAGAAAAQLASDALEAASGDPALRAEAELDLAYITSSLGSFAEAEQHAQAAAEEAAQTGSGSLLAVALAVRVMTRFLRGGGLSERELRRALALEDASRPGPFVLRPRYLHGLLALWTGRLEEARRTLEDLYREQVELGRESELPWLGIYLVWVCVWRGELEQAAAWAERSTATAELLDDAVAVALASAAWALVHAQQGWAEPARAEAARAAELFAQLEYRPGSIWPPWALGALELSLGNPAAAHAALAPLAMALAPAPGDPVLCVFLPDEVEALVELGELEQARGLLDPFEQRARRLDRGWALAAAARCRGLLAAAGGDCEAALERLGEALGRYDRLGLPLERARTLLVQGRVLRRRKRRREARAALEEALAVFRAHGAEAWAARAQADLRRVAVRRAPGDLSATELEIARLAAAGLTNREIAAEAFVTQKAVEANLARVYRKLGIRSRAQLARALDARSGKR